VSPMRSGRGWSAFTATVRPGWHPADRGQRHPGVCMNDVTDHLLLDELSGRVL
jgi:hypothetical protein